MDINEAIKIMAKIDQDIHHIDLIKEYTIITNQGSDDFKKQFIEKAQIIVKQKRKEKIIKINKTSDYENGNK